VHEAVLGSVPSQDEIAQRYRAVFDTACVGVLELDREGRVVDANPVLRGFVPGIVGRPASAVMTRADALRAVPLWRELVQGRRHRYSLAATLRRPDGAMVPGHVVVTAVLDTNGEVTGAVAVAAPAGGPAPTDLCARPAHAVVAPSTPGDLVRERPTPAEIAVLTGLASGLTLQQVAVRLGLTRRGVAYRLARLRQKLRTDGSGGVPATTAGVVARGYALGLLTPETWPPRPGPGA
jgi:PAS domain S-box-containing protein